jgi:hypothetical protein
VKLTRGACQLVLIALFMLAMVIQLAAIGALFAGKALYADEATRAMMVLVEIYAVPLGVILAGTFARRGATPAPVDARTFGVAVVVSVLWNALLLWRTAAFALSDVASIAAFGDELKNIAGGASFLVAAALAYFFAKE